MKKNEKPEEEKSNTIAYILVAVFIIAVIVILYLLSREKEPEYPPNGNGDGDGDGNGGGIPSQCEYNYSLGTFECNYSKTAKNSKSISINLPQYSAVILDGEFKAGGIFSTIAKVWVIDVNDGWHKVYENEAKAQHSYPFNATLNYVVKRIKVEGFKDLTHYGDYIDELKVHVTYYDWR